MDEPVETVIVRRQQKFEIENKLNPIEIDINDDRYNTSWYTISFICNR